MRRKGSAWAVEFCCLVIIGLVGLIEAPSARGGEGVPIRALILAGGEGSGWRETTPELRRILAETGRFDVRVCESPGWPMPETLQGFDLIVDNGGVIVAGDASRRSIADFIQTGKGLLVVRGAFDGSLSCSGFSPSPSTTASDPSPMPPRSAEREMWPLVALAAPPLPSRFLDISIEQPTHPIAAGLKSTFRTADALPAGLSAQPGAEVLASAAGVGPVLAVSRTGQGRVAGLALGSDPAAMHEPAFRVLLARAGEWAANGTVSLPAEFKPPRPAPGAIRALLVTGGHDHEAEFYSLFSGFEDLDWLPVDTSAAFQKDLRDRYDVLILYDFTRELDDKGREHLRAFVESGKGIVVLHHALLDFQSWRWWTEDVVGGRYRLQREGDRPSSSVKDHQEIEVSPAEPHPILTGIGPFRITDEAYKNLAMSPRIRPLLTTGNPTSDPNLAWIGPSKLGRVVAIQLGHGHSAFGHPSYRRLVHNAVRWAAGTLR
jgi:type 1 glutamine amidotransferase